MREDFGRGMRVRATIGIVVALALLAPTLADARGRHGGGSDRYYHRGDGYYRRGPGGPPRGYDRPRRCRRDGTGGTIIGAIAGGLLGDSIAGRGDRTTGAIVGGGLGALAGRAIDRDC